MIWTTQTLRLKSCALSPGVGVRTGMSVADLRQSFLDTLLCSLGRAPMTATRNEEGSMRRALRSLWVFRAGAGHAA